MSTINAVSTKRVWIVVLGDLGRSPRMQNHVKSFAENGYLVEVVGYVESRVNQVKKNIYATSSKILVKPIYPSI